MSGTTFPAGWVAVVADLSSSETNVAAELQTDWDPWSVTLIEPKWIPQRADRRQAARS